MTSKRNIMYDRRKNKIECYSVFLYFTLPSPKEDQTLVANMLSLRYNSGISLSMRFYLMHQFN